jgi:hypothetical protein
MGSQDLAGLLFLLWVCLPFDVAGEKIVSLWSPRPMQVEYENSPSPAISLALEKLITVAHRFDGFFVAGQLGLSLRVDFYGDISSLVQERQLCSVETLLDLEFIWTVVDFLRNRVVAGGQIGHVE